MLCGGIQSPLSPKSLMWYTAQYIDYGSRQHANVPWVILFLWKLIPGKIVGGLISERVHPGGCQECPTAEEAYPKKTCNVDGGIKDNCASLDCWCNPSCSL